jgi:hypothetical protein
MTLPPSNAIDRSISPPATDWKDASQSPLRAKSRSDFLRRRGFLKINSLITLSAKKHGLLKLDA